MFGVFWVVYSLSLTPYPQTTSSSPSVVERRLFTSKRQPISHHPLHGSGEPRHVEHGLATVQGCYACSACLHLFSAVTPVQRTCTSWGFVGWTMEAVVAPGPEGPLLSASRLSCFTIGKTYHLQNSE